MDVSWDTSASLFPDEPHAARRMPFCNHDQIYLVLSATELSSTFTVYPERKWFRSKLWLDDNDYSRLSLFRIVINLNYSKRCPF